MTLPAFLSAESEPLRRYVYGVGVGVLSLLVVLGVLTDEVALAVGGFLSVALIVPAVEIARAKTDSPATVEAKVADAYAEGLLEPVPEYVGRHAG